MGKARKPRDLRDLIPLGIGFTTGFAFVGLILLCSVPAIQSERSEKVFFESLEDFGILLTAFVTAATVFAAAVQLQEGKELRADTRIWEHTQMALAEAKAFRYWIGATYNEREQPIRPVVTQLGFKGFQQALRTRSENSFGNALVRRHEVHCRQTELFDIVNRFKGIQDDLNNNRDLLSAERYEFFQRILDLADVEKHLKERCEDHDTQFVQTRQLAEEVRDEAEADLLALVDSGYLVFANRDRANSAILNMSIFPWETVDGLLPMTKTPDMSPSDFLAHANKLVAELRRADAST